MPLTAVKTGISRSLADSQLCRSGHVRATEGPDSQADSPSAPLALGPICGPDGEGQAQRRVASLLTGDGNGWVGGRLSAWQILIRMAGQSTAGR
jgi:hypothetical protein